MLRGHLGRAGRAPTSGGPRPWFGVLRSREPCHTRSRSGPPRRDRESVPASRFGDRGPDASPHERLRGGHGALDVSRRSSPRRPCPDGSRTGPQAVNERHSPCRRRRAVRREGDCLLRVGPGSTAQAARIFGGDHRRRRLLLRGSDSPRRRDGERPSLIRCQVPLLALTEPGQKGRADR